MATKTVTHYICDRCAKPYDETAPIPTGKDSKVPAPAIVVATSIVGEGADNRGVTFHDLCPKCMGRIVDLVSQIRLEKGGGASTDPAELAPESKPKPVAPLDAASKASDNKGSSKADAGKADAPKQTTH